MTQEIRFIPKTELVFHTVPSPKPAKTYMPEWFKTMESFIKNDKKFTPQSTQATFKRCVPVLDSLTSGYIQELWCDVYVEQTLNGPKVTWNVDPAPIKDRSFEQMTSFPVPGGCSPMPLIWDAQWGMKTPKGYSVLITHPLNRYDLPFTTLSGIMDTDNCFLSGSIENCWAQCFAFRLK